MVRPNKIEVVDATTQRLNRAQSVVVVQNNGLTVAEVSGLRKQLRESDAELKVVKNRLAKLALANAECEALDDLLTGPVALAFGYAEAVAPAKICVEFAKTHDRLDVKGGLLEKSRIDLSKIEALAKLPGRAELMTQMASTMLAPARQMATALNQAMAKVVYAMKDRADQLEA